jgi:hypothetical protein
MPGFQDRLAGIVSDPAYRRWVARKVFSRLGYNFENWTRIVPQRAWAQFLQRFPDAAILEISPGEKTVWRNFGKSYTSVAFPEFDICAQTTAERFDIIIADNVFEHLAHPATAACHVFSMLSPGGWFVIATPFMVRLHGCPNDFTRWTPDGLRRFLAECGFQEISIDSWGNRACIRANFTRWAPYGWWHSLKNEPDFPVVVWGFARRPADH